MTAITTTSTSLYLQDLLTQAQALWQQRDKKAVTACYQQVLRLDPYNKIALHWLAWHTTNVYEARSLLAKLAQLEPDNPQVKYFLEYSMQRCCELDNIETHLHERTNYLLASQQNQLELAKLQLQQRNNAANVVMAAEASNSGSQITLIPPLGQLLLQAHFITPKQLVIGLKLQKIVKESGHTEATRLGEILREAGYISQFQLEQVLKLQRLRSLSSPTIN
jgi:hypothetical protein